MAGRAVLPGRARPADGLAADPTDTTPVSGVCPARRDGFTSPDRRPGATARVLHARAGVVHGAAPQVVRASCGGSVDYSARGVGLGGISPAATRSPTCRS